ncbi:MAG: response regulator, partial [Calditrichia bacterium]
MQRTLARVLILDDEYYLGKMLEKALVNESIEAMAVTDVDSAIDLLNKKTFDLVVSDIYMPGKNGTDLFKYVKDNAIEVPFIFMTGNPDLKMAVDFLTSGGYDYIIKPFMISEFIQKVKPVIQDHRIKKQEKNLVNDLRDLLSQRLSELKIYQDVFDSTDDGEIITDVDGIIVKVNPGFEKITGMSSIQLIQQPLDILKESLLPDLNFKDILRKLDTENTWNDELSGRKEDDQSWIANITFSPIRNE